jgi:hypothetical protein
LAHAPGGAAGHLALLEAVKDDGGTVGRAPQLAALDRLVADLAAPAHRDL